MRYVLAVLRDKSISQKLWIFGRDSPSPSTLPPIEASVSREEGGLAIEEATKRCCCSVAKSCPTLHDPLDCSTPSFPVPYHLLEFAQVHFHWISDAIKPSHPLFPLLLLPSIFPSTRVFSNELALPIRWPKYWGFTISTSNEYSGLISFKIDWFDLLAVQGTLKSLL